MELDILSKMVIKKVRSVSTIYTPKGAKGRKTDRPTWAIIIKYEGETVYGFGKTRVSSNLTHSAILPMGSAYTWECVTAGSYCALEFECDESYPHPIVLPTKNGDRIMRMMTDLEYKRNLLSPTREIESIRDAYSILLAITEPSLNKYSPSSKLQKISPALDYIRQNYLVRTDNDTLAEMCNMSTVYFRKLFLEAVGTSPIAYAKQLKIEKAKEILQSDFSTLGDVASALGYSSLYDFSRDFKKQTGTSPSKYKDTKRG